ncbi:MAG: hypothetical protein UV48_C0002G0015 [Candidatus Azambacteria bacterium GW2011_GWA2_42_9]|uniref:Uncharacterized protein n=3 Tax=Candidatus Azamiibacteriota TaxID=1752741 RepID=A0A0G0ZD00_9BACT|nr:MAG: hypothetical protein UV07_C0009G0021 [Candidatus Azambacteria bacterium GW2011_GWB1_42_17]KKS46564.1 MAG: hypothetical protein UV10_C0001G0021 [Candidatus Azambacteria bacterium GW2011_GWA1_42_19]KKS76072.1 MAG: hypothetical protein UV48_C0002G0015 [Candidatus Azambacteria bacterium GW2011_GWA2_42_9]KKS88870.1 MAG: hypothetical protein UV62_C0001G0012 [Parcubacteria group bacterium GW2011_GWC1_43_11]
MIIFLPIIIFFISSIIWLLILSQIISFFLGFLLLIFIVFLVFWRGFLISRRRGELFGLKNKKQAFFISLGATLGFGELIWAISFLPFSFFILSGFFTVIFSMVFDILREYFKRKPSLFEENGKTNFKKVLVRDFLGGAVFILALILIASWLPKR